MPSGCQGSKCSSEGRVIDLLKHASIVLHCELFNDYQTIQSIIIDDHQINHTYLCYIERYV